MRSKVKKAKALSPIDTDDEEALTWNCPSCGAENANFEQSCNECGLDRPGRSSSPTSAPKALDDEKEETEAPLPEPPEMAEPPEPAEPETEDLEATKDDDQEAEPEFASSPPVTPPTSPPASKPAPQVAPSSPSRPATQFPTPPITTTPVQPPAPEPSISPPTSEVSTPWYTPPPSGQGHFSFVFVNTPAQSLIKSRVPIDFDIFPVVTIGRSPENVVVIPDQEVSRKHAELTMDGSKLIIKDLQSKNGTFVYDGKQFQQVNDSAEVKPNSIVKFGTGTIVRLISE